MLLAGPRSFCAGVERAIEIVERALDLWGAPVYVRKQIVHNTHGVAPSVRAEAEARALEVPDPGRVSSLIQTTLAADEAAEVADALPERFPQLRGPDSDDICYATTNRRRALAALTDEVDLVLVVGSANSSNSLRPEWLAGVRVVGLTAGASAPPALVDEVVAALRRLGPVTVVEREAVRETVRFGLPSPRPPP